MKKKYYIIAWERRNLLSMRGLKILLSASTFFSLFNLYFIDTAHYKLEGNIFDLTFYFLGFTYDIFYHAFFISISAFIFAFIIWFLMGFTIIKK